MQIQKMNLEVARGWADTIPAMQVAIYVMVGGGMLGHMAAERPTDFYIDSRVGRLPYHRKQIVIAVARLIEVAKAAGLDAKDLPPMPRFHNLGVF